MDMGKTIIICGPRRAGISILTTAADVGVMVHEQYLYIILGVVMAMLESVCLH